MISAKPIIIELVKKINENFNSLKSRNQTTRLPMRFTYMAWRALIRSFKSSPLGLEQAGASDRVIEYLVF